MTLNLPSDDDPEHTTLLPYIAEQLWLALVDRELDRGINYITDRLLIAMVVLWLTASVFQLGTDNEYWVYSLFAVPVPYIAGQLIRWRLCWNGRQAIPTRTHANASALSALVGQPEEVWRPVAEDLDVRRMKETAALSKALSRLPGYWLKRIEARYREKAEKVLADAHICLSKADQCQP